MIWNKVNILFNLHNFVFSKWLPFIKNIVYFWGRNYFHLGSHWRKGIIESSERKTGPNAVSNFQRCCQKIEKYSCSREIRQADWKIARTRLYTCYLYIRYFPPMASSEEATDDYLEPRNLQSLDMPWSLLRVTYLPTLEHGLLRPFY